MSLVAQHFAHTHLSYRSRPRSKHIHLPGNRSTGDAPPFVESGNQHPHVRRAGAVFPGPPEKSGYTDRPRVLRDRGRHHARVSRKSRTVPDNLRCISRGTSLFIATKYYISFTVHSGIRFFRSAINAVKSVERDASSYRLFKTNLLEKLIDNRNKEICWDSPVGYPIF